MLVELWPIERVKPYERNPRLNDGAVDAVAASIKEFGFRQPIVVDRDGVIVVGHTRWKAAQKLGLKEVPVHITDLTPDQLEAVQEEEPRADRRNCGADHGPGPASRQEEFTSVYDKRGPLFITLDDDPWKSDR